VEAANIIAGSTFPASVLEDKAKRDEALKAWNAFLKN
jgi:hypothetical protein